MNKILKHTLIVSLIPCVIFLGFTIHSNHQVPIQYTESARGYMGELYESGIGAYGLMVTAIPREGDC